MKKKYFTIEDLIRFCEQKKMYNFSSKESGKPIVIQAVQDFSSADVEETADNKLYAKVRVCHTLLNRNGSYISEDSMKAAMPSLKYSPLLANIHQLDDGTWDFHSHDYHIEKDEDGNENVIYDEKQVGTFTADEPYLEYDKDIDKTYVVARVAIPESYTRCADIIREKNGTKVSCELIIYECSYNAKEKYLQLDNFEFAGCTCLGSEKDGTPIGEGMLGSKITLEDFSEENNSLIKFNEKMVELQARLEKLETACFDNKKNNSKEGGNKNLNKFEELCQKYEKTVDDITFDYKNMSDDELVEAFAKAFDEADSTDDGSEGADTPSGSETNTDGNEEGENNPTEQNPDESEKGDTTEDETPFIDDDEPKKKANNALTRTFEISHDDIRYALYNLLSSYEDADNEWYYITGVYDSYFVYESWDGGKIYGQKYTKDNDNVALDGERYSLHKTYLTDSEYAEIESMRSSYAELKAFKENVEKNELHSKKESLLADEKYSVLSDNEEFTELKKNMDNYSLDDLETKAKVIFADYVSSVGNFSLNSSNKNKSHSMQLFGDPNTRRNSRSGRYGDIFKK
uniref:Uncharacterized protein n=1 Tax=Siphoviridae sp. ctCIv11 TaxID=2827806 RepID=A0A8S5S2Z9_9CAUD|nr:MAG TPA: hypothetical protein [Siphoviridae sp. ctCIv11]